MRLPVAAWCLVAGLLGCRDQPAPAFRDPLPSNVRVVDEDTAFTRAKQEAQGTVDSLATYLEHTAPPLTASVKVPLRTSALSEDREHLWLTIMRGNAHGVTGWIENHPLDSSVFHRGDTLSVSLQGITDWEYTDSLGRHGGYTTALWERRDTVISADRTAPAQHPRQ